MSKVFVPQVPSRYDTSINCWVPIVNLDPAKEFGELEVLLPPEAGRMAAEALRDILIDKLADITDEDWLLATGDPVAMGIAMALAAGKLYGTLRVLRWNKRQKKYEPIDVQL